MRYFLLITCISFGFIALSCDGRVSKRDSLKQSISKFKNSVKRVEIVEYVPEEYSEMQTDTILSNGFRVEIKNFTSMEASILREYISNNTNYKQHFRQIESEITVYKNDKLIFKNNFNEAFLRENLEGDILPLKDYLSNGLCIDQMASLQQNKLVLTTSYFKPKHTIAFIYRMTIDSNGHCDLKKIDYART